MYVWMYVCQLKYSVCIYGHVCVYIIWMYSIVRVYTYYPNRVTYQKSICVSSAMFCLDSIIWTAQTWAEGTLLYKYHVCEEKIIYLYILDSTIINL